MNSLGKDTFWTFIARFAYAILWGGLQFSIALMLNVADQGKWYALLQLCLIVSMVAGLGMSQASLFFMRTSPVHCGRIILSQGIFNLTGVPVITIIILLVLRLTSAGKLLEINPDFLVIVFFASIVVAAFQDGRQMLIGTGDTHLYNWSSILVVSINVMLVVIFWLSRLRTARDLLLAYILAQMVGIIMVYARFGKTSAFTTKIRDVHFTERLRYAIKVWSALLIGYLNYRLVFFLVRSFLGSEASGYYSMAMMLAELLWFIPDALALILLSRLASIKKAERILLGSTALRYTFLISLVSCGFLAISGWIFISFFAATYKGSLLPFLILLPGAAVFSMGKICAVILMAEKKMAAVNIITSAIFILNIISALILVPRVGINGAAIATSTAYILGTSGALYYIKKIFNVSFRGLLIFSYYDIQQCGSRFHSLFSRYYSDD